MELQKWEGRGHLLLCFGGGGGCGWVGEGVGQRWFEVAGVIIERSVMVIICKKGRGGLMFESFRV